MTGTPPSRPSLSQAALVWARVAALSFGGPAGQIAVMHRILVEERRWLGEQRFLHALNFCMLLPGPEAMQLATYVGWLMNGVPGALVAGGLFVLPGAVSILALSMIYALWGGVPLVGALFFGLKAAVLAIVVQAVIRIGRKALTSPARVALAAASLIAIAVLRLPFPLIVAAAAGAGWLGTRLRVPGIAPAETAQGTDDDTGTVLGRAPPPDRRQALAAGIAALILWLAPVAMLVLLAPGSVFADIAVFFSRLAVVTFGGAYAALAYVAQEAAGRFGWLTAGEMLDGLGLAETTPGPLIMVVQFVGFLAAYREAGGLAAGIAGAALTSWVTFAPCFAWIFLCAPWIEALRRNRALSGALAAVTAAVVGVILNLALWFAWHFIVPGGRLDPSAALLSAAAAGLVFGLRWGVVPVLAACAAAGLALRLSGLAPGISG